MADKNEKDKKAEEDNDKKEKQPLTVKKMAIIMSAAFALIMLITVISLILILKKSSPSTNTATTTVEQTTEKKQTDDTKATNQTETKKETKDHTVLPDGKKPAIFYNIKPVFIVNLNSGRVKFLQINVEVMTRTPDSIIKLTNNLPLIKNELLILFSNKNYDEVKTLEGRESLRREALKVIKNVLEKETEGSAEIEDVLFTGFVVQ